MYEKGRKHGAAAGWRTNPSAHLLHCGGSDGLRPQQAKGVAFWQRERKENRQKDIPFHYLLTSTSLEPEYKLHYETYIFLPYASSYDSNCNGNNLLCHPQRNLHYLPLTAEVQE